MVPQSGFGEYKLLLTLRCKAFLSEHILKSTGWLIFFLIRIFIWMAGDCYVESKHIAVLFLKSFLHHVFHFLRISSELPVGIVLHYICISVTFLS